MPCVSNLLTDFVASKTDNLKYTYVYSSSRTPEICDLYSRFANSPSTSASCAFNNRTILFRKSAIADAHALTYLQQNKMRAACTVMFPRATTCDSGKTGFWYNVKEQTGFSLGIGGYIIQELKRQPLILLSMR